jgi:hypothetical protein
MNDLKRISEALPPLENVDHYEHLEKAYERGGWLEVESYIGIATRLAHTRGLTDLEKLAKSLPPIANNDHLKNLNEVYDKNQWHGVFKYVCDTFDVALIQSTNKKKGLLRRLLNRKK